MIYRIIGLMSGSSLDGLDIVFTELEENGGKWSYEIKAANCSPYNKEWTHKLQSATKLNAFDYLLLHAEYGRYTGNKVNEFIEKNSLQHKVQLISSHGHTVFHAPQKGMTAQLGDGATIAAVTGINTVSDLRALDVALGGQGAPIVPMGEKLLWNDMDYFLNLGGIANLSSSKKNIFIAYDICPANRVLNMLAQQTGKAFDEDGNIAKTGSVHIALLDALNRLAYYSLSFPKSLDNSFGVEIVFPLIQSFQLSIPNSLRTCTEHIVQQIRYSLKDCQPNAQHAKLLVTGGGAFNIFLIERLKEALIPFGIDLVIPEDNIVKYKEALIMALLGVLRWREENTIMSSVTGASRSSIGGAVWIGQEA